MLPPDLFHRHHNLVWEYCSAVSGIGDMEVVALSPSFLVHISSTHPQHFGKGMLQVASSDNQCVNGLVSAMSTGDILTCPPFM